MGLIHKLLLLGLQTSAVGTAPTFITTSLPVGDPAAVYSADIETNDPLAALSVTVGSVPTGLTFTDNSDGTATINGAAPTTGGGYTFTVQAVGAGGTSTHEYTLGVVPAAPSVTAPTANQLLTDATPTLTCSEPTSATVFHIQITHTDFTTPDAEDDTLVAASFTPASNVPLGYDYVRARAYNAYGWGAWSSTVTCYVSPEAVGVNGVILDASRKVYLTIDTSTPCADGEDVYHWNDLVGGLVYTKTAPPNYAASHALLGNAITFARATSERLTGSAVVNATDTEFDLWWRFVIDDLTTYFTLSGNGSLPSEYRITAGVLTAHFPAPTNIVTFSGVTFEIATLYVLHVYKSGTTLGADVSVSGGAAFALTPDKAVLATNKGLNWLRLGYSSQATFLSGSFSHILGSVGKLAAPEVSQVASFLAQ